MAKRKVQKSDKPVLDRRPKKEKKGFFATLFEPVAQDPDADFYSDADYTEDDDDQGTEELLHALLHDSEEEEDLHDADTVERITWEDGAPIVTDIPLANGTFTDEFAQDALQEDAEDDDAYSILSGSFADAAETDEDAPLMPEDAEIIDDALRDTLKETPDTIELIAEFVVVEEPQIPEPTVMWEPPVTASAVQEETMAEEPAAAEESPVFPSAIYEESAETSFTPPAVQYTAPGSDTPVPDDYVPLVSQIDAGVTLPEPEATLLETEQIETPLQETAPFQPDAYEPLVSGVDAGMTMVPYVAKRPETSKTTESGYTPLTSDIDAGAAMTPYVRPATDVQPAQTGYVPLASSIDANSAPVPYAAGVPAVPDTSASGLPAQAEWFDYAGGAFANQDAVQTDENGQPIRLFDDDELTDTARQRGQTTRLFRTGTSATTRIHINETEEAVRRGEAARKAEAREAKRRQDEAMARRSKKKKRSTILRGLFANIAFVLFFIAGVVVALYYGFLLSDIVVMGNDTRSTKEIIEDSGLTLGTHMLFCDLDEAKANIEQDPYLQVDSVTYIFPNRIRIIVSERVGVAGIAGLDYNVIIDDQGYVLSMDSNMDISGYLQVSGISMTGFRLGQKLGEGNDFSTATLIEIIGKLEQYELMDDVASIDLTTPLAITMKADNGLTIHVGQGTDLDNKMEMLAKLLPRFVEQSIGSGTLYLSAKGGAVYSPPYAANNAQPVATPDPNMPVIPEEDLNFVDDDGDGIDDVTGLPQGQIATPEPGATPAPTPAPTAYVPGGGADDFSG